MSKKNHNDPFGEELMSLLEKYYQLDAPVNLTLMTYENENDITIQPALINEDEFDIEEELSNVLVH